MAATGPQPYIDRSLPSPAVTRKNWLISGVLALLCGGILVLFTDVEMDLIRWLNCRPAASSSELHSDLCR